MERPWLLEKAKRRRNGSKRHGISGTRHQRKGRSVSRASVQRKVRTLQGLVPGGRRLQPEQLFSRTADYIFQLRTPKGLTIVVSTANHQCNCCTLKYNSCPHQLLSQLRISLPEAN
ncbi:unnamed protein product [Musa acuminata var. zebrina]